MGQPKDKELGIRNPIDLRVGQDVERFVGVVSQQDPGAIPRNAFQRARNMRLRGGMPVERGGQQKVITTPIASQWDGLRDVTTTEGNLRLYMPGTVYSGPWSHTVSLAPLSPLPVGVAYGSSYVAHPSDPYWYGVQYAFTADGLWIRVVRFGRPVAGESNLLTMDQTYYYGVGLSSGTVVSGTLASLLDDVGTGTLIGTILIPGVTQWSPSSGYYSVLALGIESGVLSLTCFFDSSGTLTQRYYDLSLTGGTFSQAGGDHTVATADIGGCFRGAFTWQGVRVVMFPNGYYNYPAITSIGGIGLGGVADLNGRPWPAVVLGTDRYWPWYATALTSPGLSKITNAWALSTPNPGTSVGGLTGICTDGANVYLLSSDQKVYTYNGAAWTASGVILPAGAGSRADTVYYGGRIHFLVTSGGVRKYIWRNTTAGDFSAFSLWTTIATDVGGSANLATYLFTLVP